MVKTTIKQLTSTQEKKRLLENLFSLSVLQAVNYILPLITLPYLVRVLGVDKFGLIAFAQAFIQYFVILTDYGFNFSATRDVSFHRGNKQKLSVIVSSVLVIKGLFLIISVIALTVVLLSVPKLRADWLIYVFSFGLVFDNILFPVWFFQGVEDMKYIMIRNVSAKIAFTALIFVFVREQSDYLNVPLINSLGLIVAGLIALRPIFKKYGVSIRLPKYSEIGHQLNEGWHVFISTLSISAYTNTRTFAVGLLTSQELTGFYAIAEKLIDLAQSICLRPLIQIFYPRISNIYATDRQISFNLMSKLQHLTLIAYLGYVPILYILAPFLIKVVAKHSLPEAVLAFRILLVATFFTSANAFRVQFLIIAGLAKVRAKIHLLAGGVGLILTFGLTYWVSYLGPAIALIIIEMLVLFLTIHSLRTFLKPHFKTQ
jgi:polysaccharide transporter, PST family